MFKLVMMLTFIVQANHTLVTCYTLLPW